MLVRLSVHMSVPKVGGGGGVSTLIFRPVSERPFTVNGVSLASDDDPALNAGLVALSFLGDPDQYG